MESLSRPELSDLEFAVRKELDKVEEERSDLGLSYPEDYHFSVNYYEMEGALAQAFISTIGPFMSINVLMATYSHLDAEDQNKCADLLGYFDLVRDFLPGYSENAIIDLMGNPKEFMDSLESRIPKEGLVEFKDFFMRRGMPYDAYREFAIENAPKFNDILKHLLPKIKSIFYNLDFSSLRHEMDHLDFFSSPLYSRYNQLRKENQDLMINWQQEKTQESSEKYADSNLVVLDAQSRVLTLLEIRALFFNFVNVGEFGNMNPEVSKKVFNYFDQGYIKNSTAESILEPLVSDSHRKWEMNQETSNYLFHKVNTARQSPTAARYVVNKGEVNMQLANSILSRVEEWQEIFRTNARQASEVIGQAFLRNPSALSHANKAKTFQEYLDMCSV